MLASLMKFLGIVRSDIPFARDDANRFLPWILGLMVAMTAFALCLGVSLGQWIAGHRAVYDQEMSLIIPPQPDAMQDDVRNLIAYVQKQPGIERVRVLEEREIAALVKPWLGENSSLDGLPLPVMAEITVGDSPPDAKTLQAKIGAMIPGAQIDTHESWVEKFARFTTALRVLAYTAAAFILAALAAMIVFTSQAALKLHRQPVALLHSIGADDGYIARQFQWNACALTLQGALPGTLLGVLLFTALGYFAGSLDTPLMPRLAFSPSHLAILFGLPLVCGLLGLAASRRAVLHELHRVL